MIISDKSRFSLEQIVCGLWKIWRGSIKGWMAALANGKASAVRKQRRD